MRTWFNVRAEARQEAVTLGIFGPIGASWYDDDAVTAKELIAVLDALPATVRRLDVRINSMGGDCAEATTIANALRAQRTEHGRDVQVTIEGIAASAATIVMMAGNVIRMPANALLFVHDPWTITVGDADEHGKTIDMLGRVKSAIVATYRWHSTLNDEALAALMNAETWMNADEALANGFITEKVADEVTELEPEAVAATMRTPIFASLKAAPAAIQRRLNAIVKTPTPAPEATAVLALCESGECLELARELITARASVDQVKARIATATQARATATARVDGITGACKMVRLSALADGYIRSNMALADVKAHLVTISAVMDHVEIDGGLSPAGSTPGTVAVDTAAIYSSRNATPGAAQ